MKKYIFLLLLTTIAFGQQTPAAKQTKSILILGGRAHIGNGTIIRKQFNFNKRRKNCRYW